MNPFTASNIISVITYLLPGFLAAWIFYGLTAHPRKDAFERIIQALIFTVMVQALTAATRMALQAIPSRWIFGAWTSDVSLIWSMIYGVTVGVVVSISANTDWLHRQLRDRLKITSRTSYPSEWFSAFHRQPRYVVLHLEGARRLYGFPLEWPDSPDAGHFLMDDAGWLLDNNELVKLHTVHNVLVPAKEVQHVEFLRSVAEVTADATEIQNAYEQLISTQKLGNNNGKQSPATEPNECTARRDGEAGKHSPAGESTPSAPAEKELLSQEQNGQ